MSDEQRREKRIATRQRLWCEGQESPVSAAETRDVSRNGMFIVAEDAPDVGATMKVTLQDQGEEIALNMEVVWRGTKTADNKTGIGVRIVGFDKGRDLYERFINRHLRPSTVPGDPTKVTLRPSGGPPLNTTVTVSTKPSAIPPITLSIPPKR